MFDLLSCWSLKVGQSLVGALEPCSLPLFKLNSYFYQHDTHLIFHLGNTECLPRYTFVGRIDSLSHHILKTWTTIKSKTLTMDALRPFWNDSSFSMGVVRMGADSLPPHAEYGKSKIRIYTGLDSQDGGLTGAGGDFPDTTIYNCKYPLLSFPPVHFSAALRIFSSKGAVYILQLY